MNRQMRRRLAKRAETEAKFLPELEKRADDRVDAMLNFYAASIIMAHHRYYGANKDDMIPGFMQAWNEEVKRVHGGSPADYLLYIAQIEKSTGITFEVVE